MGGGEASSTLFSPPPRPPLPLLEAEAATYKTRDGGGGSSKEGSPPPLEAETAAHETLDGGGMEGDRPPPSLDVETTFLGTLDDGGGFPESAPLPPALQQETATSANHAGEDSQEAAGLLPASLEAEGAEEVFTKVFGDGGTQEAAAPVLTDDLRDKIVRQVEYYFSDENLPTDKFLLKFVKRDKEGFVPIAIIASFRRMKKLVQDNSIIETALRTSSQLAVSLDGKKVKRLHPIPVIDPEYTHSHTVLVENLPKDYSTDNVQRIFGDVGNIKSISVCNPRDVEGSAMNNKQKIKISSKVHALVEYETIEAAENAVATLNDEKNWRSGMRVELLLKRMGKFGLSTRGRKGAFSEKNNNIQAADAAEQNPESLDHNGKMAEKERGEHLFGENSGQMARDKRRGRGHRQHNINVHGRRHVPSGSEGLSKTAPGPRMPDGTRGFTMGRGKPCPCQP